MQTFNKVSQFLPKLTGQSSENAQLQRLLINHIQQGMVITDWETVIQSSNRQAGILLGMTVDDLQGKLLSDLVADAGSHALLKNRLRHLNAGERLREFVLPLQGASQLSPWDCQVSLVFVEKDKFLWLLSKKSTTLEKQTIDANLVLKRLIRLVQEPDGNAIQSLASHCSAYLGTPYCYIYLESGDSYSLTSVSGMMQNLPPNFFRTDAIAIKPQLYQAGENAIENELGLLAREERWKCAISQPLNGVNGYHGVVIVGYEKLTNALSWHLEQVEILSYVIPAIFSTKELATRSGNFESNAKTYRDIIDSVLQNSFDGVLVVNTKMNILDANAVACELFGYEIAQLNRLTLDQLIFNPSVDFQPIISKIQSSETYRLNLPIECLRRDGKTISFELRSIPYHTNDEMSNYRILFVRDLTVQRELEEATRRMRVRSIVGENIGNTAHQLRNILNDIAVANSLLLDSLDEPDTVDRLCQQISDHILRGESYIANQLSLVKEGSLKYQPTDIKENLSALVERCRKKFSKKNISIATNRFEDMGLLDLDWGQMEQAIENILNNAVQAYNGKSGTVYVNLTLAKETAYLGRVVDITISDEAFGVIDEMKDRLGTAFQTAKKGGTGIGLSQASQIIQLHGGILKNQPYDEVGTVFVIRLPKNIKDPVLLRESLQ
jgi:PAS domain S-box-containing protein